MKLIFKYIFGLYKYIRKMMECRLPKYSTKVAIVGTGLVGSTAAYALMMDGVVSELVLIDKNKKIAEGHALDLMHGMQFTKSTKILAGDSFELVKGAQIVVICAGIAQKSGQSRAELLEKNVVIFKEIVPQIVKYNKDCILLVVTNPLDVLTYLTYKLSGFDSCRVFGTGTVLDTSRLRYLLGAEFKISPKDITAYILGEHGDSQFVWWSHANIAGVPITNVPFVQCSSEQACKNLFEQIHQKVKNSVYEVIQRKGATYFAIATVIAKVIRAILLDQSRVFTISTVLKNYKRVSDICLSIPTIIRCNGICKQFDVALDEEEEKSFMICVEKIKSNIEDVGKITFNQKDSI